MVLYLPHDAKSSRMFQMRGQCRSVSLPPDRAPAHKAGVFRDPAAIKKMWLSTHVIYPNFARQSQF